MGHDRQGLLGAAALAALGSVLPWGSIGEGFSTISVQGFGGESGYMGIVVLAAAACLAFAAFSPDQLDRRIPAAAAGALFILGFPWPSDSSVDSLQSSTGPGILLIFLAGIVAIVFMFRVVGDPSSRASAVSPSRFDPGLVTAKQWWVVGAAGMGVITAFLPWMTSSGESLNGFTDGMMALGLIPIGSALVLGLVGIGIPGLRAWFSAAASGGLIAFGLGWVFFAEFGSIQGRSIASVADSGIGAILMVVAGFTGLFLSDGGPLAVASSPQPAPPPVEPPPTG